MNPASRMLDSQSILEREKLHWFLHPDLDGSRAEGLDEGSRHTARSALRGLALGKLLKFFIPQTLVLLQQEPKG